MTVHDTICYKLAWQIFFENNLLQMANKQNCQNQSYINYILKKFKFKKASFDDIQKTFEEVTGSNLQPFFYGIKWICPTFGFF